MRASQLVLVLIVVVASSCTSVRVTGFVTDQTTGEPVSGCGVLLGPFYTSTDAAGHFTVKGRTSHHSMDFIAAGYERKTVAVDSSQTRYPTVNVQLTPKGSAVRSGPSPVTDETD